MVSAHVVASSGGVQLSVQVHEVPLAHLELLKDQKAAGMCAVLVHQYSLLGGAQALMRGLATELNALGYRCITFDLRGVGRSSGRATVTGKAEVDDVAAVCRWAAEKFQQPILLVGSSAGAPIAGSAIDLVDAVKAYVGIGYTFGMAAGILFSAHFGPVLKSPKPKLFIMGTADGFTSPAQFRERMAKAAPPTRWHLVPGVGHFQLEAPDFDNFLAKKTAEFAREVEAGRLSHEEEAAIQM
eukprot:TRINITY_DN20538_c0_g1_i1.p1 TRINITY_DN20538_c0_g1~~TRINITY_DN20538_c0_g1_i1.p1  ORF type:complete len:241 (+),score=60.48 TRINITY_DN20538_c0_g1_i1:282-1004(+)